MYKKILLGIDGSFYSEAAGHYAIKLAKACNSQLLVVSIIKPSTSGDICTRIKESVDFIIEEAKKSGLDAKGIVKEGSPVRKIKKIVEKHNVDLVMVTARHHPHAKRLFVRSIAQRLMLELDCSVIMIRLVKYGNYSFKKILLPLRSWKYYFTERRDLLESIGKEYDSFIRVLRVQEMGFNKSRGLDREGRSRLVNMGMKMIEPFILELEKTNLNVQGKAVISIKARDAIISEAARGDYDLIIMGAFRKNIVKGFIKGNPVEEVLKRAPCNMFIWYPKERRKEKPSLLEKLIRRLVFRGNHGP